jgi:hypothetical protein
MFLQTGQPGAEGKGVENGVADKALGLEVQEVRRLSLIVLELSMCSAFTFSSAYCKTKSSLEQSRTAKGEDIAYCEDNVEMWISFVWLLSKLASCYSQRVQGAHVVVNDSHAGPVLSRSINQCRQDTS